MSDGPQVYRTNKVESLEHYRQRYNDAGPKERKKMAMLQAESIHRLLIELTEEIRSVKEMLRQINKDHSR